VLISKAIEAIESKIAEAKAELQKTSYSFTFPLPDSIQEQIQLQQ